MKSLLCLSLLVFLRLVLTQENSCECNEVCKRFSDPECKTLKDDYSAGRISKAEVLEKKCSDSPRKFCCPSEASSSCSSPASTEEPTVRSVCEGDRTCTRLRNCQPIVKQFQTGQISKADLIKLKCNSVPSGVCCPQQVNPEGPDSASYIPSAEKQECGGHNDLSNIIGGQDTKQGRYPFIVVIGSVRNGKISYECGGSLINRWYVLSAAHCFYGTRLNTGKVTIGDWNLATDRDCSTSGGSCLPDPQTIQIEDVIVHENYIRSRTKVENDIALVKLQQMVEYNPYVTPVCLPIGDQYNFKILSVDNFESNIEGVRSHAIGWGISTNDSSAGPEVDTGNRVAQTAKQQFVDLPIISESKCQDSWRTVSYEKQVCAGGENGKDSCRGDSGGPLVISKFSKSTKQLLPDFDGSKWYLVGLTSYGSSSCGTGKPGVYTRISKYIDWIKENMK